MDGKEDTNCGRFGFLFFLQLRMFLVGVCFVTVAVFVVSSPTVKVSSATRESTTVNYSSFRTFYINLANTTTEEPNTFGYDCREYMSCSDKCYTSDSDRLCHCDEVCLIHGDCCFDFFPVCVNVTIGDFLKTYYDNFAIFNAENNSRASQLGGFASCSVMVNSETFNRSAQTIVRTVGCFDCIAVEVNSKYPPTIGYKVVSHCPESWLNRSHKEDCENGTLAFDNPPVHDRSDLTISYKNIPCAKCHGKDEADLLPWSIELLCPAGPNLNELITSTAFIRRSCRAKFDPSRNPDIQHRECTLNVPEEHSSDTNEGKKSPHPEEFHLLNNVSNGQVHVTTITSGTVSTTTSVPFPLRDYEQWCKVYDLSVTFDPLYQDICRCPKQGGLVQSGWPDPGMVPLSALFSLDAKFGLKVTYSLEKPETGFIESSCEPHQVYNIQQQTCLENHWSPSSTNESNSHQDPQFNGSIFDNCSLLLQFSHADYIVHEGSTRIVINGSEYKADIFTNTSDALLVCRDHMMLSVKLETVQYNFLEAVLNYIGMGLSLAGLFITVMTYALFSELRTLPGKMVMTYSVCIFIAILLFMTSAGQVTNTNACVFLGIMLHYFWLCSFLWLNALSFDISRSFSSSGQISVLSDKHNHVRLLAYFSYANGFPALIVAATISAGIAIDNPLMWYRGGRICWIRDPVDLYAFYCPVAAVIVLNVVFFVRSVRGINTVTKIAKFAKLRSDQRWNVVLFIKLSFIMGLSWGLFYTLVHIQNEAVLVICSTVNSLQGFFVFSAFVCTKRILCLYKKLLKRGGKYATKDTTQSYSQDRSPRAFSSV